jgi:hypothetical protein
VSDLQFKRIDGASKAKVVEGGDAFHFLGLPPDSNSSSSSSSSSGGGSIQGVFIEEVDVSVYFLKTSAL